MMKDIYEEAMNLIEGVLDTLCEVGNGVTEEHLKQAASELFAARDLLDEMKDTQPEYEPVKAEDFAKTMSENTIYNFMAWHGEALELMERHGFVICKKTM